MRILQINKFHFIQGGADKYYLDISQKLKESGHKVANFAMQHPKNADSAYKNYFVSQLDFSMQKNILKNIWHSLKIVGRTFWSTEAAKQLEKLIVDFKPDVAHLHTFYHQLSPAILKVLKKHKVPVVMTVHDMHLISCNYVRFHHNQICSHTLNKNFWQAVPYKCVKNSYLASGLEALGHYFHKWLKIYEQNIDLFIFPSEFQAKEHIVSNFKMKRYKILNNYINTETLAFSRPRNNTSSKNSNFIIYVGRLSEEKGIDVLIKAYAQLNTDIKLKIIGDGPKLESYKLQVTSYKLDNVDFLGHKSNLEVKELIASCKFLVFPSQALENQPLVILEAMSLGVPVIASDIGGVPEIIDDKKNGLLFKPGDSDDLTEKMNLLLSNKNLINELGKVAKQKTQEKFAQKEHMEKLNSIYQDLVKNKL